MKNLNIEYFEKYHILRFFRLLLIFSDRGYERLHIVGPFTFRAENVENLIRN